MVKEATPPPPGAKKPNPPPAPPPRTKEQEKHLKEACILGLESMRQSIYFWSNVEIPDDIDFDRKGLLANLISTEKELEDALTQKGVIK